MSDRQEFLERILYPVVRVRAKNVGGSGTIVWSGKGQNDKYETYVLTNYHVVSDLIKIEKKYNSFLEREEVKETLSTASIELFQYPEGSRLEGRLGVKGDIVAYTKDLDLALLKTRTTSLAEYVARLAPPAREGDIFLGEPVWAVGAALGHEPIMSDGVINFMDDEIDDATYWLTSANIIFGNSGGAVFLDGTREFIGVPSRMSVAQIGWSFAPITHMGFFVPFPEIYQWLRDQYYQFIIGEESYEACRVERDKARDEMRRMADMSASRLGEEAKQPQGQYYTP